MLVVGNAVIHGRSPEEQRSLEQRMGRIMCLRSRSIFDTTRTPYVEQEQKPLPRHCSIRSLQSDFESFLQLFQVWLHQRQYYCEYFCSLSTNVTTEVTTNVSLFQQIEVLQLELDWSEKFFKFIFCRMWKRVLRERGLVTLLMLNRDLPVTPTYVRDCAFKLLAWQLWFKCNAITGDMLYGVPVMWCTRYLYDVPQL